MIERNRAGKILDWLIYISVLISQAMIVFFMIHLNIDKDKIVTLLIFTVFLIYVIDFRLIYLYKKQYPDKLVKYEQYTKVVCGKKEFNISIVEIIEFTSFNFKMYTLIYDGGRMTINSNAYTGTGEFFDLFKNV